MKMIGCEFTCQKGESEEKEKQEKLLLKKRKQVKAKAISYCTTKLVLSRLLNHAKFNFNLHTNPFQCLLLLLHLNTLSPPSLFFNYIIANFSPILVTCKVSNVNHPYQSHSLLRVQILYNILQCCYLLNTLYSYFKIFLIYFKISKSVIINVF